MILANLHYYLHWPQSGGYNFVSGPLADITLLTAFLSWMYLHLKKHNCHVHKCWRLQWHVHPDHGHPVCKHHHPHAPDKKGSPLHHHAIRTHKTEAQTRQRRATVRQLEEGRADSDH